VNSIGSSTNIGNLYVSDFRIVTKPFINTSRHIKYNEGKIGIGTTANPSANMHVATSATQVSTTRNMVYFSNLSATPVSANYNLTNINSIFDSSMLVSGSIASSSDTRIKTNIAGINDESALDQILSIQPKTYNYIDQTRSSHSVDIVYGFIAQQIQEVIPEAVTKQTDIVPNIYKYATVSSLSTISISTTDEIKINDKIEIIDMYNMRGTYRIVNKNNGSIVVDKKLPSEMVFVYGTTVNDFHTLNKCYIYTLNVCATQILSQKIDKLKMRLKKFV
jgi:hypothetical protein